MGEAQMIAEQGLHLYGEAMITLKRSMQYNGSDLVIILSTLHLQILGIEKGIYETFEGSKWSKGIMPMDQCSTSC